MNRTKIPWADYTWNPITGCSRSSPGCDHCYAAALSKRFGWPWGRAVLHPGRLGEPAKVRKPSRVFVCSMADLWHSTVEMAWQEAVYEAMRAAPWHTYIMLTKRPQNMTDLPVPWPTPWWIGVTGENQEWMDLRWQRLTRSAPAADFRFVSVEPMIGPVSIYRCLVKPDWVICGPETGPGARPCDPWWIADLAHECSVMGVPFFDKRDPSGSEFTRREFPV